MNPKIRQIKVQTKTKAQWNQKNVSNLSGDNTNIGEERIFTKPKATKKRAAGPLFGLLL